MERPQLVHPPHEARVASEEMIRFEWSLAPVPELVAATKLSLYVGRDPEKPFRDPEGVKKTWIFTPEDPWLRYNETANALGLDPGETYYWQVGQQIPGRGVVASEVRALRVVPRPVPSLFRIKVYLPKWLRRGRPLETRLELQNDSTEPVRLTFRTDRHFELQVWATRGILKDRLVWSTPAAQAATQAAVEVPAGSALVETVVWDQRDSRGKPVSTGRYRLIVRSLAEQYRTEGSYGFQIRT